MKRPYKEPPPPLSRLSCQTYRITSNTPLKQTIMPPIRTRNSTRPTNHHPMPIPPTSSTWHSGLKPSISRPNKLPATTKITTTDRPPTSCESTLFTSPQRLQPSNYLPSRKRRVGAAGLEITSPDPSDVPPVSARCSSFAHPPIILIPDDVLCNVASLCCPR